MRFPSLGDRNERKLVDLGKSDTEGTDTEGDKKPKKKPTAPEYPEELTMGKQKKGVKEEKGPSQKRRRSLNFLLVAARGSGKIVKIEM